MDIPKHVVTAPLLCDLSKNLEGRHFSRLCFGARRDVLVLSVEKEHMEPYGRLKRTASFRLHHWQCGQVREIQLTPSDATFYLVSPVGEDYLCIAACRANEEQNAHLFNGQGDLIRTWDAGHSIQDVQFNSVNEVWASYIDEGVFTGNPTAPSRQGLNCFDTHGNRIFGFLDDIAKDSSNGLDMICDCYALNVASNHDTWLCYYTEFPLVHLRDRKVQAIFEPPPQAVGSDAFAVRDTQRLFTGGYHNRNQLFWRDEASGRQVEIEAVDEEGEAITWNRARGRGADLFLCNGAQVRLLSLNGTSF